MLPKRTTAIVLEPFANASTAFLPYVGKVTDRIGRILRTYNINTFYKPTNKVSQLFRLVNDPRQPLLTAGVYRMPCLCGSVYVGTTQRCVNTRLPKYMRHCRLLQHEKSAVAEHVLQEENHAVQFDRTNVLFTVIHFHTRMHMQAIEIYKNRPNFQRRGYRSSSFVASTFTQFLQQPSEV